MIPPTKTALVPTAVLASLALYGCAGSQNAVADASENAASTSYSIPAYGNITDSSNPDYPAWVYQIEGGSIKGTNGSVKISINAKEPAPRKGAWTVDFADLAVTPTSLTGTVDLDPNSVQPFPTCQFVSGQTAYPISLTSSGDTIYTGSLSADCGDMPDYLEIGFTLKVVP